MAISLALKFIDYQKKLAHFFGLMVKPTKMNQKIKDWQPNNQTQLQ